MAGVYSTRSSGRSSMSRGHGRKPSSEDDEENEEIMRANANIMPTNANNNANNTLKPDNTKSAADNWKGIGNRHMASQEYQEAYKAYSAALSISPLGPSSHIYLSNRAAALLSLKRYSAASVDARRAITLAPTFGKAHARLGQSLYFLKDYAGAVAAYENAFQFEPENQVTWTYLNKAKRKFVRENERKRRKEEAEIDDLNRQEMERGRLMENERERGRVDHALGGSARGQGQGNVQGRQYEYEHEHQIQHQQEEDDNDALTNDGVSVTDSENLANMAISVVGETNNMKDNSVAVLSTHHEGDDIDQLVAAVDRGETSIVRGKLQAALDSSNEPSQQKRNHHHSHDPNDPNDPLNNSEFTDGEVEDPDFDEALRLQEVAAIKLVNKEYRGAVEEFSAALFLVPDDTNLTPQLYIGRAHALNGLHRHEGAINDSMMALGRNPELPEAHVVLARTYFYVKNFSGAVSSFENAKRILREKGMGDQLSPLDELYYEKASEKSNGCLGDAELDEEMSYRSHAMQSDKPIPKLKPPRFVSRQELLNSTSNVPPMPKAFSNQMSNLRATTLHVDKERIVVILSDTLGIKLNRGQDGIIRVLSVAAETPAVARRGELNPGDVIREVAGLDLRRPLTSVMWSDTVAHMKLSPRPLHITVAKELSKKPPAVQGEFRKSGVGRRPDPPNFDDPPSRASGMEPVSKSISEANDMQEEIANNRQIPDNEDLFESRTTSPREKIINKMASTSLLDDEQSDEDSITNSVDCGDDIEKFESMLGVPVDNKSQDESTNEGKNTAEVRIEVSLSDELNQIDVEEDDNMLEDTSLDCNDKDVAEVKPENSITSDNGSPTAKVEPQVKSQIKYLKKSSSERLDILPKTLNKDFIFIPVDSSTPSYEETKGFTNTRWMAESYLRTMIACGDVSLLEKGRFFWQGDQFVPRTLALYSDLLIIGRQPKNAAEIRSSMSDPNQPDIFAGMSDNDLMQSFLIAESGIDFKTCKLRLSQLTTPSSVQNVDEDEGQDLELRKACFEIITPTKTFVISALNPNEGNPSQESERLLRNNRELFLTSQWEEALKDTICDVNTKLRPIGGDDKSWTHQIILGTLHSHIVSGNYSLLEKAIIGKGTQKSPYPSVNNVDDDGLTPLHHACYSRSSTAVAVLLNAGADCAKTTMKGRKTPCHISAKLLDAKSLSMILSQSQPSRPDPNALDEDGYTPMTVAVVNGRAPGGKRCPESLNMCVASLQAWNGQLHIPYSPHPIHILSNEWCHEELEIVFPICDSRFPAAGNGIDGYGQSLGALFDYPLHVCVMKLREKIVRIGKGSRVFPPQKSSSLPAIVRTLEALLNQGYEPNERIENVNKDTNPLNEMIGYTPIQILAAAALDVLHQLYVLKCDNSNPDLKTVASLIAASAEILVTKGARTSVDQPPTERFCDEKIKPKSEIKPLLRYINRSEINIEKNGDVMKILDGNLNVSKARWNKTKTIKGLGQRHFLKGKGLSMKINDSKLTGGSDEKNCAICWKKFGSLRNRKHICRASRRYVCEECSSNTVLLDGDARRVSDGQFNLARCNIERKEEQDRVKQADLKQKHRLKIGEAWAVSHGRENSLKETKKDENAAKEELFGDVVGRAVKNFFMEEVEVEDPRAQAANANERVTGMMSTLTQTGQAFSERGEKLNTLVEKTDALKNASEDFAKMARELKESQQGGLFW